MSSDRRHLIPRGGPQEEYLVQEFPAATWLTISHTLSIPTTERVEVHDLTPRLRALVAENGIQEGMVNLAALHTTTAIVVNENQAALLEDIRNFLNRLLPRKEYYRHNDPQFSDCERHNADAHLKCVLLGQSMMLPIVKGSLALGQWQSVLFVEFDGPQTRTIHIQIFGTYNSTKG